MHNEVMQALGRVLDPELDEPITALGFVESVHIDAGCVAVAVRLPTSWCAANFAFLMAADIRRELLALQGVRQATVRLGDHFDAAAIEQAVNAGARFTQAFPGEAGGDLAALRQQFLRKGFAMRQERVLRQLRAAGASAAQISALRIADAARTQDLKRYLERRAELGLDCGPGAALIVDAEGRGLPPERIEAHYAAARTQRVSMEANGSFCRALLAARRPQAAGFAHQPTRRYKCIPIKAMTSS